MSRSTTKIIIAQEDGTVVGQYFLGDGEHLIGRAGHCTIQLDSNHVSREHARLIISAEAIEIEDLNSTTGTFIDGINVKGRIPLSAGQKLWISNLYIDIERQGFGGLIEGSRLGNGRFTLKRELGKGGMGAVWLALDEEVQENVALKLVSGEIGADSASLKDLQREVNKAHKLVHPNIVRMGYFWKEEGEPAFISLEYVDGTDLHNIRSDSTHGLLAWEEVKSCMIQLCDALEYAHSQKVAHRDIKPSNFMINSAGNLKLADFGIAASLANTSSTFTSNTVLGSGTPPYMSPQQLDGERPEVTDDIYSVGATFYELLTSKPPFYRGDISYQVRHTEVIPMAERLKELDLENDIPEYVSAIVMACLKKDREKRPQSMRVIREWIQEAEEAAEKGFVSSPVLARETQTLETTSSAATTRKAHAGGTREKRTNGIAVAVIIIGVIITLAGFAYLNQDKIKQQLDEWKRAKNIINDPPPPPGGQGANIIHLINPTIEEEIRKQLNKSTANLTTADYEKVVEINLNNNHLTDVNGLRSLTQLRRLFLHDNELTDVKDLENLAQLKHLNLSNNKLTDVKILKDLAQLTYLNLSTNKLTDVKVLENLAQLTYLNLDDNQLTDVGSLEKLTQLTGLWLGGNQLTSVQGLQKFTQLEDLSLSANQLTDVQALEKLTQLKLLDLAGNPGLTKAQIDQLQQALPNCNITHNRKENGSPAVVPNVPAGKSQQWTYRMGRAENDIEKIYMEKPESTILSAFGKPDVERKVDSIVVYSYEKMRVFEGIGKLYSKVHFTLEQVSEDDLNVVAVTMDPSSVVFYKAAASIDAAVREASNKPTGELVASDYEKVTILKLNDEAMTKVPKSLEKLTQLRELHLWKNQLTDLKFLEDLTHLTKLDLDSNKLIDVKSLEKLTQLEDLDLRNNPDLTKARIAELQRALPKCKILD